MSKIYTVKMPDIGEGVVEGEVVEWLKNVNDLVEQDEPVVVLMTDKATVELPAPYPGKIMKHYFQAGETAMHEKPLYDIELSDEIKVSEALTLKVFRHLPLNQKWVKIPKAMLRSKGLFQRG